MFKEIHKFTAELSGEHADRNKEIFSLIWNITATQIKAGSCNDGMNMRMVVELLPPCMENLDNTGNRTEKFFVSRKLQDCFSGTSMDEIVEQFLICIEQRIQLSGDGKDKMVVGSVNDL